MEYDQFLRMMYEITQKIPNELNNNKDLVMDIIRKNGMALEYASEQLRDNYEVVRIAVHQNGMSLQFASKRMQNNDLIVMSATSNHGKALQFASENLRDDIDIVLNAIWTNNTSLEFASENVKKIIESQYIEGEHIDLQVMPADLPESVRLSYPKIRELDTDAQEISTDIHIALENPSDGLIYLDSEIVLRLEGFIRSVNLLTQSVSTFMCIHDVVSDLEYITYYYQNKEWSDVARWLKNINSSLREMWSEYIVGMKMNRANNGLPPSDELKESV